MLLIFFELYVPCCRVEILLVDEGWTEARCPVLDSRRGRGGGDGRKGGVDGRTLERGPECGENPTRSCRFGDYEDVGERRGSARGEGVLNDLLDRLVVREAGEVDNDRVRVGKGNLVHLTDVRARPRATSRQLRSLAHQRWGVVKRRSSKGEEHSSQGGDVVVDNDEVVGGLGSSAVRGSRRRKVGAALERRVDGFVDGRRAGRPAVHAPAEARVEPRASLPRPFPSLVLRRPGS